jgi:hypothetical protein
MKPLIKCCCRGPRCVAPNGPVQLASNFSKYCRNKDGLNNLCKRCDSADKGHIYRPKPVLPAGYKMCSRGEQCKNPTGAVQKLDSFYKNVQSRDGLTYQCRACMWQRIPKSVSRCKHLPGIPTLLPRALFNA